MNRFNYAIALLGSAALLGGTALAAPPIGAGVGVGGSAGAHVGVPAAGVPGIGAPHVGVPSMGVPQAGVPLRPASVAPAANAKASMHVNSSTQVKTPPLHGTLTAIRGTAATVRLTSGTMQTYTVSAKTARQLRAYVNKPIAFVSQNGVLSVAGREGNPPQHGTVSAVNGTNAVITLADGAKQSVSVTSAQAAYLAARVGKPIVFWTKADGSVEFNQSSHATNRSHR